MSGKQRQARYIVKQLKHIIMTTDFRLEISEKLYKTFPTAHHFVMIPAVDCEMRFSYYSNALSFINGFVYGYQIISNGEAYPFRQIQIKSEKGFVHLAHCSRLLPTQQPIITNYATENCEVFRVYYTNTFGEVECSQFICDSYADIVPFLVGFYKAFAAYGFQTIQRYEILKSNVD